MTTEHALLIERLEALIVQWKRAYHIKALPEAAAQLEKILLDS